MKKLHYIFVPFFLNLIGFFLNDQCVGTICFYPGRGFPLAYYHNQVFNPDIFVIDYFLLAVAWFIGFKTVRHFVRQKHHETPEFTSESL